MYTILLRKGARPRGYVDECHELLEEVSDDQGASRVLSGYRKQYTHGILHYIHQASPSPSTLSHSPCTYRHGNLKLHFHPLRRFIGAAGALIQGGQTVLTKHWLPRRRVAGFTRCVLLSSVIPRLAHKERFTSSFVWYVLNCVSRSLTGGAGGFSPSLPPAQHRLPFPCRRACDTQKPVRIAARRSHAMIYPYTWTTPPLHFVLREAAKPRQGG